MIDLSPDAFRELGYRAIDLIAEQLAAIPDAPVRRAMPDELRQQILGQPLPKVAQSPTVLLEAFASEIFPYPMGNVSPRFFGWVNSPPAPLGILADLLAAALNSSVAGGDHAATYVEHAVLNWLKSMMTYPADSGALLASGGSVANLLGLAVMRHVITEGKVRVRGLGASPFVIYTSTQGHSCVQKAVELLGFGSDYLRKIPVDDDYQINVAQLRAQIKSDRGDGLTPVCVVASAGTVNTGAIDPLEEIADVHVDGAYGGFGILAAQTAGMYKGIERADSLAVDPHKWLYVPVECGCALVRDAQAMRDAFSLVPPYLRDDTALPWFSEFGIQQTRGFKALKLWLVMQQIGEHGYRELISRDVALARVLQARF
jgi:glutamate/tyrosine decarboxylase-like PLP-dependent enzyme